MCALSQYVSNVIVPVFKQLLKYFIQTNISSVFLFDLLRISTVLGILSYTGNSFAAKYQDLYTSVPYVMSDTAKIRDEIEHSITGFDNNWVIDVCEVLQAVRR